MRKKLLVAMTGVERYPEQNRAAGIWLGEVVHFVSRVEQAGYQVAYISPRGGYTPLDPLSLQLAGEMEWAWYQDKGFMRRLSLSLAPEEVRAADYLAVYYAGGRGALWDLPTSPGLQAIARYIFEHDGYVAAVGHGVAGLLNIRLASGDHLIYGREITGFSNEEEALCGQDQVVPFLTETELLGRGALYRKAAEPWVSHVAMDGRLITGQNPASAGEVASCLVRALQAQPVLVA